MTDNEIIKALECCITDEPCKKTKCPFYKNNTCGNDIRALERLALGLINRLQAEVEDKDILLNHQGEVIKTLEQACKEQMAENERLRSMNQVKLDMIHDLQTDLITAKAEAYKEFAEELLETKFKHGNDYIIYAANIDNLLKEKVGE